MIKRLIKELIFRIRGEYTVEHLVKLGLRVGKNFNPQLGYELDPSHCWLIEIGDNVTFGPHVQVLAHDASTYMSTGYTKIGKVKIGDNVFIGAGSIILPNTSIGNNSIVAAGSVVTHPFPDGVVIAGNPAKIIKSIEEYEEKNLQILDKSPKYGSEYTLRECISEEKKQQQIRELDECIGYVK